MDLPGKLSAAAEGNGQGMVVFQCRRAGSVTNRSFRSLSLTSLTTVSRQSSWSVARGLPWGNLRSCFVPLAGDNGADERWPRPAVSDVSLPNWPSPAPCGWRPRGLGGSSQRLRPTRRDPSAPAGDDLTAVGKIGQISNADPRANTRPSRRSTLSPIESSKGPNLASCEHGAMHVCQPNDGFPAPICLSSLGKRRNCSRVKLAPTKLVVFPHLWKARTTPWYNSITLNAELSQTSAPLRSQ